MSTPSTTVYGLYQGLLLPHRLGGLSRGREWWVEGPFLKTRQALHRTILSAAFFVDGQVHGPDNRYGAAVGEHSMAELIAHFLLEHRLVAVIEDGTVQTPIGAAGRETYSLSRLGMPKLTGFARWEKECRTIEDIQEALAYGAKAFVIDPESRDEDEVWSPVSAIDFEDMDNPPILSEEMRKALQWLVGTSNTINDTHRYVPQALWEVTPLCRGILVFHADRNEDCLTVYSKEPMDWDEKIGSIESIKQESAFWIECPVPTMLLRWKRALYESCDNWEGDCPTILRELVPIQIVEVDEVDEVEDTIYDSQGEDQDENAESPAVKEEESSESTDRINGEE